MLGNAPRGGEFVEIIMDEKPLRAAMLQFSVEHPAAVADHLRDHRGAGLSGAALPVRAAAAPDDRQHDGVPRRSRRIPARVIVASGRQDEIGTAERELGDMQRELSALLQQKTRLAALGLAVSKINHDLRNLLSSAQLFSDRLSSSQDQQVQRFAPKLMRALERAISFCESTCPMAARRSRRRTAVRSRSSRWWRRCASRSSSRPTRRSAGSARSSAG